MMLYDMTVTETERFDYMRKLMTKRFGPESAGRPPENGWTCVNFRGGGSFVFANERMLDIAMVILSTVVDSRR